MAGRNVAGHLPKFVHLDLKGAPPKLSYLRQLLPFFKRIGIDGILLEYEDAFPFSGDLAFLAGPNAYNYDELASFLAECHNLGFELVPLVQTFGHVEFVLKHRKAWHLREHPDWPNSLCPSNEEAFAVVSTMLDQVTSIHLPHLSMVHIGCDEVHQLAACAGCKTRIAHRGWSKHRLFAEHVARVAQHVKAKKNGVRVLMWDDMLRGVDYRTAVAPTGLGELAELVVWYYGAEGVPDVWAQAGHFRATWAATAFKGASGPTQTTPDIALHVENHKLWSAVLSDKSHLKWAGIILTGWSRYDHLAVLCELLPAGLPSLAVCARLLQTGGFTRDGHQAASSDLGFCANDTTATNCPLVPLVQRPRPQPVDDDWQFPGHEIYSGSHQQANLEALTYPGFFASGLLRGWYSTYLSERGRINAGMVSQLDTQAATLSAQWATLQDYMRAHMSPVYDRSVVDEWLGSHVQPHLTKLQRVRRKWAHFLRS